MEELRGAHTADLSYLQALIDTSGAMGSLWLVTATVLVLLMQAGFLLLESGAVRAKNTINVAQKNIADMMVSGLCFVVAGATIMFGASENGWIGLGGLDTGDKDVQLQLFFQFAFCATAATIVSGAAAERIRLKAFILVAAVIALLVYPLFGHQVWGATLIGTNRPHLAELGFLDYAGSTVVHVIGGGAALAVALALGPRTGRFDADGKVRPIPGHSSVQSLFGTLVLMIGWFGFNAGAAVPGSSEMATIITNTIVALCFGGSVSIALAMTVSSGRLEPRFAMTGMLGSLVAITAGCAYVSIASAAVIGTLGAVVAIGGAIVLLNRFHVDDPVDAVAVHALAGIAGTIATGVFAAPEHVQTTRLDLVTVQAFGAIAGFVWAFTTVWIAARLINLVTPLRVSAREEEVGLNLIEHGSLLDVEMLMRAMGEAGDDDADQAGSDQISPEMGARNDHGEAGADIRVLGRVLRATQRAQTQLNAEQLRARDFEKVGNDWLFETDADLRLSYLSERFYKVFGEEAGQLIGTRYLRHLKTVDVPVDVHAEVLARREPFSDVVFEVSGTDGKTRVFSVSGLPRFDDGGAFLGYRGRATDITEAVKAQDEIRYLAHHDTLTGLRNRTAFKRDAQQFLSISKNKDQAVAVISLDLDGFKLINDNFGHSMGDDFLQVISRRLSDVCGDRAICARYGGDEFAVITSGPHESIEAYAQRLSNEIIDAIATPVEIDALELQVGCCAGVALCPAHGTAYRELLRFSDMALYESKAAGRGTVTIFDPSMENRVRRRKKLEFDIRSALKENQFYLVFQPQVRAQSQQLMGFEALLRWEHPELGGISPVEFISIAEKTGQIVQIGEFVLREAARIASGWPKVHGRQLTVGVNVSPLQFFRNDLTAMVEDVLAETGLDPRQLEIEITEGTLVRDADSAVDILHQIRALGVKIAMDDFGTGYSSLSYLQKFPIDRLKVDRAFVRNLEDGNERRITAAIVSLGKSLNLEVVAEGCETIQQYRILCAMYADYFQGFLFSRPLSQAAMVKLIAASCERDVVEMDPDMLPKPEPAGEAEQAATATVSA